MLVVIERDAVAAKWIAGQHILEQGFAKQHRRRANSARDQHAPRHRPPNHEQRSDRRQRQYARLAAEDRNAKQRSACSGADPPRAIVGRTADDESARHQCRRLGQINAHRRRVAHHHRKRRRDQSSDPPRSRAGDAGRKPADHCDEHDIEQHCRYAEGDVILSHDRQNPGKRQRQRKASRPMVASRERRVDQPSHRAGVIKRIIRCHEADPTQVQRGDHHGPDDRQPPGIGQPRPRSAHAAGPRR